MLTETNKSKKVYTFNFVILFFSLFTDIKYPTSFGIIRLFDILTIIYFLYIFFNKKLSPIKIKSLSFFFIFLVIHVSLSYKIGFDNLLREFLQSIIILFFLYILLKVNNCFNYKLLLKYGYQFSILITLFVIFWHLYNGIFGGWKLLQDSRIIFTILTVMHFLYFKFNEKQNNFLFLICTILLFLILIFSGERKALLIFFVLIFLFLNKDLGFKSFAIVTIFFIIFYNITNFTSISYINKNVLSLKKFQNTGNFNYTLQTGDILDNDSFSNVVRMFQLKYSKDLFLENPLFGIGTNGYLKKIEIDYGNIFHKDHFMRTGIHGEFQRILVENGLFGLIFYILIWFKSWISTNTKLNYLNKIKILDYHKSKFLMYSIFLPSLIYIGLEGSSLRGFIILGIISLIPHILENYKQFVKMN